MERDIARQAVVYAKDKAQRTSLWHGGMTGIDIRQALICRELVYTFISQHKTTPEMDNWIETFKASLAEGETT